MEGYLASVSLGDESTQMWTLNKRLEAYLSRVKALEEENEILRVEIHNLKSTKSERCWKKKYHEEMMSLRDALDDSHREMVQAEMERDGIFQEMEFLKQRCLEERQAREDAKKELSESKKLLEEETRAQNWLKERLGQLEFELEDILKEHEEEKALMEEEISSFSQKFENFRATPIAYKPVDVEDYARKLSDIWHGAVEEYKSEVSMLETSLSEANENLRKVMEENKQNRLLLQNLDKELVSLKMRKETLEDLLSKQWQEQKEEEEKLQLEVETLEREKQDLRAQIAEVLEDRQQLMHLKMSLSLEVATYRSLLEVESTRFEMPDSDRKASSVFNDSMLENIRRRQSEYTRKPVSRDQRQSYGIKKKEEKNELFRPPLNNLLNIKSSAVSTRTSPVTKEFQKVSSVLHCQGLKYTALPQVKDAKTLPKAERPPSGEAIRKTKEETLSHSNSHSLSTSVDQQIIRKDIDSLNASKSNSNFTECKSPKKDELDHDGSHFEISSQKKDFELDCLDSVLKALEDDFSNIPSGLGQNEDQIFKSMNGEKESQKKMEDKPIAEQPITFHFVGSEPNGIKTKGVEEEVTQVYNIHQQSHMKKSDNFLESPEETELDEDFRALSTGSFEKYDSEYNCKNNKEPEIISKHTNSYLGNEHRVVHELADQPNTDSEISQSFNSDHVVDNLNGVYPDITNCTDESSVQINEQQLDATTKLIYPEEVLQLSEGGEGTSYHVEVCGQLSDIKSGLLDEQFLGPNQEANNFVDKITDKETGYVEEDTNHTLDSEEGRMETNEKEQEHFLISSDEKVEIEMTQEQVGQMGDEENMCGDDGDKKENDQESQKNDTFGKSFNAEALDQEGLTIEHGIKQSFEQEVDDLGNEKQKEALYNEECLQESTKEPKRFDLNNDEQLSSDDRVENINVNDMEEVEMEEVGDSKRIEEEDIRSHVLDQMPCASESESDSPKDLDQNMLIMEDEEPEQDEYFKETKPGDSIMLEESDPDHSNQSEEEFDQTEGDLICTHEDWPEETKQQDSIFEQEQVDSSNGQETNEWKSMEKEELVESEEIMETLALDDQITENENENSNKEFEVNENVGTSEDSSVKWSSNNGGKIHHGQFEKELLVDENIVIENVQEHQTLEQCVENIEGEDDVMKAMLSENIFQGLALSRNQSTKMDDATGLVSEENVSENDQSNWESGKSEFIEEDKRIVMEQQEEEYIKTSNQREDTESDNAEIEEDILTEKLTETLNVQYLESKCNDNMEDPEKITDEQVNGKEGTTENTEDNKMENENSESEDSVDSQEISLFSQKSEEFEISKDYQLEQTLPDTTPLPNLEVDYEDLSPSEQPDCSTDLEFQLENKDNIEVCESKAMFLTENKEDEEIELICKTEELTKEEFVSILDCEEQLSSESSKPSDLLGDAEDSEEYLKTVEFHKMQVDNLANFMEEQMSKTQVSVSEQIRGSTELSVGFADATFIENINESEYVDESKSLENNTCSPPSSSDDESQSEDSVISDNEAITSSYEGSPNATESHVSEMEESKLTTTEIYTDDINLIMTSETHSGFTYTDKETCENVPNSSSSEEVDFTNEGQELDEEVKDSSSDSNDVSDIVNKDDFGDSAKEFTNQEKVNGVHEANSECDKAEEKLNGHSDGDYSEIIVSNKKTFQLEGDILEDVQEDSIINFAMSEVKSEGFFQSLLETSQPKDGSRIDEVLLAAESKKVIAASEYPETNDESRFSTESFLVGEVGRMSENQQVYSEKYEGLFVTKTQDKNEDSWSSDE
ncbi:hypothetical protein GDO86_016540 [Hymenochirus boettgeri]|uniref:IF rod domain-containing protein n=1 Tax=Hymenochirus boettgeri TaxID=247094 RepID=A0A8T2K5J2_9PIPI|nr:hypothetical protein GDO86_016540 [Hymenochirus boettgeri]